MFTIANSIELHGRGNIMHYKKRFTFGTLYCISIRMAAPPVREEQIYLTKISNKAI